MPNSRLHEMRTLQHVLNFYREPVANLSSYRQLARDENRPKNLHLIEDVDRFRPPNKAKGETDATHPEETAFPKQSAHFHHLRTRRLNEPFRAKTEWAHFQESEFAHYELARTAKEKLPWTDPDAYDRMDPNRSLDDAPENSLRRGG